MDPVFILNVSLFWAHLDMSIQENIAYFCVC